MRLAIMMNSAFRTFLNLLLAVSLAVTPLSTALAAMDTGSEQHTHSAAAESCHHGHEQTVADTQEEAPMMAPCSCCGDDFSCPDDNTCNHKTASPVDTQLIDSTANHDMAPRLIITALPCTYSSLNSSPDTPPPLA